MCVYLIEPLLYSPANASVRYVHHELEIGAENKRVLIGLQPISLY